MAGFTLAR